MKLVFDGLSLLGGDPGHQLDHVGVDGVVLQEPGQQLSLGYERGEILPQTFQTWLQ